MSVLYTALPRSALQRPIYTRVDNLCGLDGKDLSTATLLLEKLVLGLFSPSRSPCYRTTQTHYTNALEPLNTWLEPGEMIHARSDRLHLFLEPCIL